MVYAKIVMGTAGASLLALMNAIQAVAAFTVSAQVKKTSRSPSVPIRGLYQKYPSNPKTRMKFSEEKVEEEEKPALEPLQPFIPAMDPMYAVKGPVGEGDFIVSRSGPPTAAELSDENILKIVKIECSDLEVNTLVWKCLGYRYANEKWDPTEVFPKWKERFPDPPDLIGMQRVYSREVDEPSLRSNQALVRSIPAENKQSLKPFMQPLGWKGYQYGELTPNKTRRAQCANWLIYYREELFGYSVEELQERRRLKKEAEEEAERKRREEGKTEDEWKPPVTEVF